MHHAVLQKAEKLFKKIQKHTSQISNSSFPVREIKNQNTAATVTEAKVL